MRDIKFRAWDGKEENMIFFDLINKEEWNIEYLAEIYTIMQYTGLKDKNGVEIYEGDIVSLNLYNDGIWIGNIQQMKGGAYYINHKRVTHKYKYQIHCEVCEPLEPIKFLLESCDSYELEVIGNIYENPELSEVDNEG